MRRVGAAAAIAVASAVIGPTAASAAPISYGFDGGSAQGWKVANNFDQPQVAASANPTGGNPGGHLFYNDFVGEPGAFVSFFSPILPAGSLAANYGGTIAFDFRIQAGVPTRGVTPRLTGPQGDLFRVVAVTATNAFQRVGAPLTPPGWNYCPPGGGGCSAATEAEVRAVLSGATQVELEVDARDGTGEDYSIDNVSITDPPQPPAVQQPGAPSGATPVAPKRCKRKGRKGAEVSEKGKRCKRKKKK